MVPLVGVTASRVSIAAAVIGVGLWLLQLVAGLPQLVVVRFDLAPSRSLQSR